jgi:hypothetical protein
MKDGVIYYNYLGFSIYFWTLISITLFLVLNIIMITDILNKYYNNILYGAPIAIFILVVLIFNNNNNYRKIRLYPNKLKLYKYIFGYRTLIFEKIINIENNIIVTIDNNIALYIDDDKFWNDLKHKYEIILNKNTSYFNILKSEYSKLEKLINDTKYFIWRRKEGEYRTALIAIPLIAIPVMIFVNGIYRIIYFSYFKNIKEQKMIIKRIHEKKKDKDAQIMKSTKNFFVLLVFTIVLPSLCAFILASCAKNLQTAVWTGAVTASYDDEIPEDSCGIDIEPGMMRVEKTAFGGDIFSFVSVPLGIDYFVDEITEAKLFLYASDGPKKLLIGTVNGRWTLFFSTREEAKALVDKNTLTPVALQPEDDGWFSVLVTDIVKAWVRADIQNFGFALFPLTGEAQGLFADMYNNDGNAPYLKVSGRPGKRPEGYAKFGFTRVPEEGRLDDTVNGNCLSYALRDSVPVFLDDLGSNYRDINRVLSESGEDGVADFISGLFEKYVEEHKTGLRVSKLRRIDDFNSSIDPAKEYRIVMRLGCYATEDMPLSENARNFDFHFWAQLADGRWSQKYGWNYSEIIPATGPGVSPEKYYWEMAKYGYLYRSKMIFRGTGDSLNFFIPKGEINRIEFAGMLRDYCIESNLTKGVYHESF